MTEKIKKHFETEYSSSPVDVGEDEIQLLIKHDCECDNCGTSIFELNDFPERDIEKDEVLCENCYNEEYRDYCPICEESYEKSDLPDEFPKSPFYYIGTQAKSGIYHALSWPVFCAATGGLGTTYINWESVELVCTMEDFQAVNDPNLVTEFSDKWKAFLEDNKCEYAGFIGSCCYGVALKISNLKNK